MRDQPRHVTHSTNIGNSWSDRVIEESQAQECGCLCNTRYSPCTDVTVLGDTPHLWKDKDMGEELHYHAKALWCM